jgi:c-di-GMP-related signal transduction protein
LAARVPQSESLKSSHDVVDSCLRLGESISQEQNPNRAENITLASVALAASIINHINASNGRAYRS